MVNKKKSCDPPESPVLPEAKSSTQAFTERELNSLAKRSEINRKEATDKIARQVFVGCVSFLGLTYLLHFIAAWTGNPISLGAGKEIFSVINYIAVGVMGYLFGRTDK